jgi:hypothetical protein
MCAEGASMSAALLWVRCNLIGNRFARRGPLVRALTEHVDVMVFWWCVLATFVSYVIGWPA